MSVYELALVAVIYGAIIFWVPGTLLLILAAFLWREVFDAGGRVSAKNILLDSAKAYLLVSTTIVGFFLFGEGAGSLGMTSVESAERWREYSYMQVPGLEQARFLMLMGGVFFSLTFLVISFAYGKRGRSARFLMLVLIGVAFLAVSRIDALRGIGYHYQERCLAFVFWGDGALYADHMHSLSWGWVAALGISSLVLFFLLGKISIQMPCLRKYGGLHAFIFMLLIWFVLIAANPLVGGTYFSALYPFLDWIRLIFWGLAFILTWYACNGLSQSSPLFLRVLPVLPLWLLMSENWLLLELVHARCG